MGNDHAVALRRELVRIAREGVQAMRQIYLFRVVGGSIHEIGVDHPIFIDDIAEAFAVGRKISGVGFPFQVGDPCDLFGGDVEQGDVHVTALGIGTQQQCLVIGR